MSRSLDSSRRQSPWPAPVLPDSPFAALPPSSSSELKCSVSLASRDSVSDPKSRSVSSNACTVTSPASAERLMTRTKPCRPSGSEAAGNSGTPCMPASTLPGAVDRFVRCPVGSCSRLMTITGRSDATRSAHLPVPSPRAPWSPAPDSSTSAAKVRAPPAGTETRTSLPGDAPRSSMAVIVTAAACSPAFTSRSRLTCSMLLPGLKISTR